MSATFHSLPPRSLFGEALEIALATIPGTPASRFAPRQATALAGQPRLNLLDRLDAWFTRQEQQQREAYLAQAQDICDLERRIRHMERHGSY